MQCVEAMAEVRYTDAAGLPSALKGAESLFVWDFLSTAVSDAWPSADRLRWIHIASAGVDRLLFPDLVGSNVVVTNSRGIFDRPIAEYVLGLVLAIAKDLPTTLQLQREGTWRHRETQRIDTRCALVIGTGSIGRAVGALLRAAGMSVSGVGRTARTVDPDLGVVHVGSDLAELLPAADYVIVAAPLTDSTKGMFGADEFARMKSTAWLVNVARGALVVQEDLLTALASGEIGGAALDVFGQEPLPKDDPLWTMPNVIVSPHMSGDFVGWLEALVALFADNVDRWLAGEPLRNEVDKQAGYVTSIDRRESS
ncbi:MAG: D-2-hydroxyacid dehydrogenase [Geodermatophilaceae bacterium]|nr:D-2-hydroxyacid dehydrogenase [Geodermatophilaceae bacterium]